MTFWRKKDDPVSRFRDDLTRAIDAGNPDTVKSLVGENMDVPLGILGRGFDRAVAKEQLKIAQILLDRGAKVSAIGMGTARLIVAEERHDAFRLLSENGLDFTRFIVNDDAGYKLRLRYMNKALECEQLRDALAATKAELTGQPQNTISNTNPRGPKPDGGLSL